MKNTVTLSRFEYAMACLGIRIAGPELAVEVTTPAGAVGNPSPAAVPPAPRVPVVVEDEPNLSC